MTDTTPRRCRATAHATRGRHPQPGPGRRHAGRRRDDGPGHPRQRPRPHQAQHLRPGRDRRAAGDASTPSQPAPSAGEIQAVAITGKPFIFAVGADLTGVPTVSERDQALDDRPRRARGIRLDHGPAGADLRVRQRRGDGRRRRDRPAPATTGRSRRACRRSRCPRPSSASSRAGAGATSCPTSSARRTALTVIIENPMNDEPDGQGAAGALARHRRRDVRARRLPRRVGPVGGRRRHRRDAVVERAEVSRDEAGWEAAHRRRAGPRRRQDGRPVPGALPRPRAGPGRPHRHPRRGVRRRGRGARRPPHGRGAAGRPLRLRPRPEAGQAPGRGAGPVPGPTGDQGRHRRCGAHGQPARPPVRPAARGAGRHDRPRRGAGRQGRRLRPRARSTGCSARAGSARTRPASSRVSSPGRRARTASPTPTSSSRRSSRRSSVKQQVFAEVEEVVSAECVLASNTSSLSITEMASGLAHPERVVGFHFFNPVAVMPLLEIIPGDRPTTRRWRRRSPPARR